jgi:hypothetical protein
MTASRVVFVVAACALVLAGVAGATKPRSNTSTGAALVFWTNPVESLGLGTLTDQKDAASAVPITAYEEVTLTHLDGSGFLRGDYARIRSQTGNPAYSPASVYRYDRHDDEFEQVMAYYWITEAQLYLQHLGFRAGGPFPAILDEGIDARINTLGFDNSYFWDKHHVVRFGKGGVDDAEDGEVILHEYGHAIHGDQVPGFGDTSLQAGAIGEAFGDYFAVSMGEWKTGNAFDVPCVADWDSVSYTDGPSHCLRRVDQELTWPKDARNQVHADGRIWSRALWDIRQALGPEKADRIIINAQFDFAADTTFAAAAKATVAEAVAQDPATEDVVCKAFVDRGFITNADC